MKLMKKLFFVVMVLVFFVGCKKSTTEYIGNWIKKSDFEGIPRGNAVSFVIGDKVYICAGYNSDQDIEYLKDFWVYDTTRDFWTKLPDLPGEPRIGAVAFAINGKGYIGTGYNGSVKLKDFWEFDPATNTWKQKADFGGSARYDAVGFSLGNLGYLGTGYDDYENRDFWQYDPTANQWTQIASMGGSKRRDAVEFTMNGKAYVTTGTSNGVDQIDLWQFDPTNGVWTEKNKINATSSWTISRTYGTAFVLGSKAYVCLGYSGGVRNDCWEYDPTADSWTNKTAFEGSARQNSVSFVVNNQAFIATGRSGNYYFSDIWQFMPFDAANANDN
jgi:N-acetylneuraminic acid mutarotase